MLPVIPTTSGENRARQAAATACRARSGSGDEDHGDVAERLERRLARVRVGQPPGQDRGGTGRGGRGEVSMPVGPLALQRDEQVAGLDEPRVDGPAADGAAAASHEGPARRRSAISSAVEPGGGRRAGHHARECRIGRGHGLTSRIGGDRLVIGDEERRADRVVRDPPEQLERHDRHLQVAEADDRGGPLLDPHRDDEVGVAGVRPM